MVWISLCSTAETTLIAYLKDPDHRDNSILFPGNLPGPRNKAYFWGENEVPLPPSRPRCNFIHPRQLSPFLERLELPFSSDEILSSYEDIVSSGTDQFAAWDKTDSHCNLVHHMVDVRKPTADFREASERRFATSAQTNCSAKNYPMQKRLSIYNWGPRPCRGKEDAYEKVDRRQVPCRHATRSS